MQNLMNLGGPKAGSGGGGIADDPMGFASHANSDLKQAQTMKKINDVIPGDTKQKMAIMNKINDATGGNAMKVIMQIKESSSSPQEAFSKIQSQFKL
ncbi:Schizosaccharomyces specific protein Tam13 [Schizosaccharomyces osmophilus]|uniref:Schizosaccharomyces specific protein Tam13 n=1 Tax=Schizosaccharomyces osmophilus TaxID=2545709 RepID=A0AAE9W899_9SCHI|nr:Schizosaccharomyces specific protein Tam13 [Schizosaccharomyces osmophilus]WBW71549.1 Schizosaccharomyces specific protein Tam13 [Schizosaccharomyces osmophilus]